jgi:hypothetical protein
MATTLLVAAGCGGTSAETPGGSVATGKGTVSGMVNGARWTTVASSFWIGKPGAGSPPAILFLFEAPTTCAGISAVNWDKNIGTAQVLEIGLTEAAPRTFQVHQDLSVAYLRGDFNPDADKGTVTVSKVNPTMSITGAFDISFGADALTGTFEALYCAAGVEP